MRHFVFLWMITTVAVMIAPVFIGGIRYDTAGALIGAALFLGILNAFVRPVLLIHVLTHHAQIGRVEGRVIEAMESGGR